MNFPPHVWNDQNVRVRPSDGYVCLTDIYIATDRQLKAGMWLNSTSGQAAVRNVQRHTKIKGDNLVQAESRQTWAHPTLAWCYATSLSANYAEYLHSLVRTAPAASTSPALADSEAGLAIAERLAALYERLGGATPDERQYLAKFLPPPPEPEITVRAALTDWVGADVLPVTVARAGKKVSRAYNEEFGCAPSKNATELINGISVPVNTFPESWLRNYFRTTGDPA